MSAELALSGVGAVLLLTSAFIALVVSAHRRRRNSQRNGTAITVPSHLQNVRRL